MFLVDVDSSCKGKFGKCALVSNLINDLIR